MKTDPMHSSRLINDLHIEEGGVISAGILSDAMLRELIKSAEKLRDTTKEHHSTSPFYIVSKEQYDAVPLLLDELQENAKLVIRSAADRNPELLADVLDSTLTHLKESSRVNSFDRCRYSIMQFGLKLHVLPIHGITQALFSLSDDTKELGASIATNLLLKLKPLVTLKLTIVEGTAGVFQNHRQKSPLSRKLSSLISD